jgi:hypothetical protein
MNAFGYMCKPPACDRLGDLNKSQGIPRALVPLLAPFPARLVHLLQKMAFPSASTTFELPDLIEYCKFPLKISPYHPVVTDASTHWIGSYGVFKDKAFAARFFADRFDLCNALGFPDANEERFRLACDYINLLFVFDDVADDGDLKNSSERTRIAVDLLIKALHEPKGFKTSFIPVQMLAE